MRTAVIAALTTTALVAGTGSSLAAPAVSAKDKAAIIKVLNTVERSTDPAKACASFTSAQIKTMFGTKAQCQSTSQQAPGDYPKSITVWSMSVSGSKAKAKVRENGGSTSGISGTWHLVRSGATWKVSSIEADYFRSLFSKEFGSTYKATAPGDPFAPKAYRACGLKGLLARSDKSLLSVIYQMQRSRNSTFGKVFSACSSKAPGGKPPWHRFFDDSFRAQAKAEGLSDDVTNCIVTKLDSAISETTLINTMVDGPGTPSDDKFNQQLKTIVNGCTKGGTAGQIRRPQGIRAPHPLH